MLYIYEIPIVKFKFRGQGFSSHLLSQSTVSRKLGLVLGWWGGARGSGVRDELSILSEYACGHSASLGVGKSECHGSVFVCSF